MVGGPGSTDRNVIGQNRASGIELAPSRNARIENNRIGTDIGGTSAWPNGVGIFAERQASGDVATDLTVIDNLVSGNSVGIRLVDLDGSEADLETNRIGTAASGSRLPNVVGVDLDGSRVRMLTNTVAYNAVGITIAGTQPVDISRGPIFANDARPIFYETPPVHEAVPVQVARGVDDRGRALLVITSEVLPAGGVVEVFGNPDCSNREGRVPQHRTTIGPDQRVFQVIEDDEDSVFGRLDGFTTTLTVDASTSPFSICTLAVPLEDSDRDGSFDLFEDLGPNGGDADGDGTPDRDQANVATVLVNVEDLEQLEFGLPFSPEIAVIRSPAGTSLNGVDWIEPPGLGPIPSADGRPIPLLPEGLFQFQVVGVPVGGQVTIEVVSGESGAEEDYIKVDGPSALGGYRVLPQEGSGDRAVRTSTGWQLVLTDGGAYDSDGAADGFLSDPGGPALLLTADVDRDGDVDDIDRSRFNASFGAASGDERYDPAADLDADGTISFVDYQRWIANQRAYQTVASAAIPVPEPGRASMLAAGALLIALLMGTRRFRSM